MSVVVSVRVTPRAGVDAVDGVDEAGALRVRVRAAPSDGAANVAVMRLLARELGVAPSRVAIVSGQSARSKRFAVDVDRSVVARRWPGLLTREG